MATILLSAAGAAFGGSMGGSFLGLSMVAWGRFAGATLGRAIDQSLMGQGSESIETGRVERFHLANSGEGRAIPQAYGRVRVGGQVIWTTHFTEKTKTEGGDSGKGAPATPEITTYHYSISMALALCEGEIAGVSRIWADGVEISAEDLNMRVYPGTRDQLPDPKMEAVEGVGEVPAYRGTAYVVLEDFKLEDFGNRVPQLSFEVLRPNQAADDMPALLQGVALLPGTGEYVLATTKQYFEGASGGSSAAINVNTPAEVPDIVQSLGTLADQAENCNAISLVVSWFGDDLRAGQCRIKPKVEQKRYEAKDMKWKVSGLSRGAAEEVARIDDKPVYGGTPADKSVVSAIERMNAEGRAVMFYPFILMEQLEGNNLPNPYGGLGQPPLPWRGRITTARAPGQDGSTDGTIHARAEVEAFIGTARASDFRVEGRSVVYTGPDEWSFSRFILHYATLTKAAGGVEAFCIGSELRGLTQIRDHQGFPFVEALRDLVTQVRSIVGPDVKLSYAADWSEYFGYRPGDGSGDVLFHLDPLWSHPQIDFIGIDNYMPISDWRDGRDHADAAFGRIHNLEYLDANIEGGEGFDWYYSSPEAVAAQRRTPIVDTAHGEDWIFRHKDIRSWWENSHHDRVGGVRQSAPTDWIAQSKPIWFTELGCPAVDKGTNQPNVFLDPKSSESALPRASNGQPDEDIQRQYLRAMHLHWSDPANNPVSGVYEAPMLDMSRAFVWAWDARPYPWFPALTELWADGDNYRRGHWITGRLSSQRLADVVAAICERVGVTEYDVSDLVGMVRGYLVPDVADGRRALQPLMLTYGFDAVERDGLLVFRMRQGRDVVPVDPERIAEHADLAEGELIQTRASEVDLSGRVRLHFHEAEGDYDTVAEEAVLPDDRTHAVSDSEVALTLTRAEGRQIVERWLAEARISRDSLKFALPPSRLQVRAGDVVALPGPGGPIHARVDRVEVTDRQLIEAVRMEDDVYQPAVTAEVPPGLTRYVPAVPVTPVFLDLPLLTGDEVPHAPHFAAHANPWPGPVALYASPTDAQYRLNGVYPGRAIMGETETDLAAAPSGRIDQGAPLRLRLYTGALQSVTDAALLGGANALAIGDGSSGRWEVLQFRDAELVSGDVWQIAHRLRGQAGSDGVMPDVWPAGSLVVRLNGAPEQIDLASSQRRQELHFRIGPASRPLTDPSYTYRIDSFEGIGLRPYSPVHLGAVPDGADLRVNWIRRSRIDGDDWSLPQVPLGEEREAYIVQVWRDGLLLRETETSLPIWTYPAALRAVDLAGGPVELRVAQVSARFGPGPSAGMVIAA